MAVALLPPPLTRYQRRLLEVAQGQWTYFNGVAPALSRLPAQASHSSSPP